eukprot:6179326-Pleurochrysis_carterae.AAC.1
MSRRRRPSPSPPPRSRPPLGRRLRPRRPPRPLTRRSDRPGGAVAACASRECGPRSPCPADARALEHGTERAPPRRTENQEA